MDAMQLAILEEQMESEGLYAIYERLVKAGNSPGMAAMLTSRRAPAEAGTDRVFWEGRTVSEYDSPTGQMMLRRARAAGISTQGKFFVSGLARQGLGVCDPEAWVSSTGDIASVANKRDLTVEGVVKRKRQRERKPQAACRLAPDIVERFVKQKSAADPEFARKSKREQREAVIDQHGAKP